MPRRMGWLTRTAGKVLALCILLAVLAPLAAGSQHKAGGAVVIAVIDTGVRPDHQEFVWGGPSSTTDQFVAWWDFSSARKPAGAAQDPFQNRVNGQVPLWDPFVTTPYDDHGHGTATASLAAGANRGACGDVPKAGYAPGAKLAVLKVSNGSAIEGDLALAIRYASEVVRADIISLSIGGLVPFPGGLDGVAQELRAANARGTLPVLAAGNGVYNLGLVPYPSSSTSYGHSTRSLVVGSGTRDGVTLTSTTSNGDPEVAAWGDGVCVASHVSRTGYRLDTGTSFSTPLVAGMAAAVLEAARAAGAPADPGTLERILKHAATDTAAPYYREGWGFLGDAEFARARAAGAAGTLPAYTPFGGAPVNANALYEQVVGQPARYLFEAPGTESGIRWGSRGGAPAALLLP